MTSRQAEDAMRGAPKQQRIAGAPLAEHIDKGRHVHELALLVERAKKDDNDSYLKAVALADRILEDHAGDGRIITQAFRLIRGIPMEDRMLEVKRKYEARLADLVDSLEDKCAGLEAKLRPSRIGFGNF
ncbi:MAG TPA: hypothetical protein VLD37_01965 [Candidatus Bilamarchaeum sp.]|nr:hypothetical protein [Candidatus Bilamarchaeum sp.]